MEKETEKPDSNSLNLEKELFDSRTVLISAPVNSKLAMQINARVLALRQSDSKKPIYVYINSPGGEVHSGYSIFDTLRFVECPIVTIVTGLAASMGSIIALAAPAKNRLAMPNAKFLIHQPSVQGGLGGSVSDIEIHAQDLIETKNQIIQLYMRETGRTEDEIRKAIERDKWMNVSQAKEFGLIHRVVESFSQIQI